MEEKIKGNMDGQKPAERLFPSYQHAGEEFYYADKEMSLFE